MKHLKPLLPLALLAAIAFSPTAKPYDQGSVAGTTTKRVIVVLNQDQEAIGGLGPSNPFSSLTIDFDAPPAQIAIESALPELSDANPQYYSDIPVIAATLSLDDIEKLENSPLVASITEDRLHRPELGQTVSLIGADTVHTNGYDGSSVAVAIIDTGVDNDHQFVDNVTSEACYSNAGGFGSGVSLCPGGANSSTATDSADDCDAAVNGCDHGTHVAGIAAGDGDGAAFTGVAKGADIIAIQTFTRFNSTSSCFPSPAPCALAYTSDIISSLNRVLALHNDNGFTTPIAAANLSLGGGTYSNQSSCDSDNASTKAAIDALRSVGIATAIASGNASSSTGVASPGCISTAIAVGATTESDAVASYSNSNTMVDLLAPGSSVTSSIPGGSFATYNGTSMATPHVAGTWALLKQAFPSATVDEILAALITTGTSITDSRNSLSFPRINVDVAFSQLANNVTVTATDAVTSENGKTATVQFSLNAMPSDDVIIPLSISNSDEGTLGGVTEVTITPANWNQPANNSVTITGVDDSLVDGDQYYTLITGDPTSNDTTFDTLAANDVADINLKNVDDELQHPDGTVINDSETGQLYLIENQQKRYIPSVAILESHGFTANDLKTAFSNDLLLPSASNLSYREGTLLTGSSAAVYASDQNGTSTEKRSIPALFTFLTLGYNNAPIVSVNNAALPNTTGAAISDATTHPDGTVVQNTSNGALYLIEASKKRSIPSMNVFYSHRFKVADIEAATPSDLALASAATLTNGPSYSPYRDASNGRLYIIDGSTKRYIPSTQVLISNGLNDLPINDMSASQLALSDGVPLELREGTLVKGSNAAVYIIDDTGTQLEKRAISSLFTFTLLGYNNNNILTFSNAALPSANGSAVESGITHPDGTIVQNTSNGALYLIQSNKKRYISTLAIYSSYAFNNFESATAADLNLTNDTNLPLREGSVVKTNSSGALYVIDHDGSTIKKRPITSISAFNLYGYSTSDIITVPESILPSENGPAIGI